MMSRLRVGPAVGVGLIWAFLILFLIPDLSMVGYLRGPVLGARVYNLAHTYVVPLFLAVSLPVAALTAGMTSSAINSIERRLNAGSVQFLPA